MIRIGVLADYDSQFRPHTTIPGAVQHSAAASGLAAEVRWIPTDSFVGQTGLVSLEAYDALWGGPGSPFRSLDGMLQGIRFARERGVPFLGTCAGFQHAVLEYARNVLNFVDAASAEYDPGASQLFVSRLVCSPAGKHMTVRLLPGTMAHKLYGAAGAVEEYYCNFGINPDHEDTLERGGMRISGRDQDREARIIELPTHPFFIATLFVPQTISTAERPHTIITGFLRAAAASRASTGPRVSHGRPTHV